jgi:hypothetical protein
VNVVKVNKNMDDPNQTAGGDDVSLNLGLFDIQEAVAQRLAFLSKKSVQLSDLLDATKFTKQEICQMYRGFKQVSLFLRILQLLLLKKCSHFFCKYFYIHALIQTSHNATFNIKAKFICQFTFFTVHIILWERFM